MQFHNSSCSLLSSISKSGIDERLWHVTGKRSRGTLKPWMQGDETHQTVQTRNFPSRYANLEVAALPS